MLSYLTPHALACRTATHLSCLFQDVNISTLAGEDHNSMTAHEEWLVAETFKAVPDEKVIEERMNLTATTRLADVASMSVEHMKRKYPYLMDFERVSCPLFLFFWGGGLVML